MATVIKMKEQESIYLDNDMKGQPQEQRKDSKQASTCVNEL